MNPPGTALELSATAVNAAESFLVFSLAETAYAVEARAVQEIIALPALTRTEEAPGYIAGLLNLRGKVLPVMDLWRRFGRPPRRHRLEDSVIVLDWQGASMGIIVNDVHEVQEIPPEAIEECPSYGRGLQSGGRFQAGVAKLDRGLTMLLHLENLLHLPEELLALAPASAQASLPPAGQPAPPAPVTDKENAVFRERAERCLLRLEQEDFAGLMPLAIVGLDDEYFGVDLGLVREFTDLRDVTRVPCCPPHIVGQMNLRGDILTVVDLRRALSMPAATARKMEQVMIVQVDDLITGVAVKSVHDVVHLHPAQVRSLPLAAQSRSEEFLRGAAASGALTYGLLDLPRILQKGGLLVEESIQ